MPGSRKSPIHHPAPSRAGRGPAGSDLVSRLYGIVLDSGVLNPDSLKGKRGARIGPKASLRDRIDSIIAHEWAEDNAVDHGEALKAAAKTDLSVSDGARRILKAMAR